MIAEDAGAGWADRQRENRIKKSDEGILSVNQSDSLQP